MNGGTTNLTPDTPYFATFHNPPFPTRGKVVQFGSSTTMRGANVTAGLTVQSYMSTIGEGNILLGSRWDVSHLGQSGATIDTLLALKSQIYAANPAGVVLQLGANDLTDEASAEIVLPKIQSLALEVISFGIAVAIQTPHYNGTNWRGALHLSTLLQDWGRSLGIPVIDGITTIAACTDKVGTAKSGSMAADSIHVNDVGARLYGYEYRNVFRDGVCFRILPGGAANVSSELFANPRMTGSTAVLVGESGFTGTKATDWTHSRSGTFGGSVTISVGADSEGAYEELTIPWGASNDYITIEDAGVNGTLSGKTAWKFRHLADVDVVTLGTIENIRCYIPFSGGVVQHPNGNPSNFSGVIETGRRMLVSPQYDTAITGTALSYGSAGLRISASGAGTSVVRIRGISARESRW